MAQPPGELKALLESLLGSPNVYFQPPTNLDLKYPCFVFQKLDTKPHHADNFPYKLDKRYQVTYIDRRPDSDIPDKVAELPSCVHDRSFVVNGLNHDVFNLFF